LITANFESSKGRFLISGLMGWNGGGRVLARLFLFVLSPIPLGRYLSG
jgi:hypothetical protein